MKTKNRIIVLAAFIGMLICHHIFGYIGHFGFDDLHYAKLANDLNNGIFNSEDHFSFRIPVVFLTSLFYSIFGVSDFASSLPPLLISVLILIIVFILLQKKGNKTLIIGLALTTLSQWFIFYSDKLMPDIYVAFAVISAIGIIHQKRYSSKNNRDALFALLFIFALLFGFMAKGTIVLIIPLLFYYFMIDIIQKRNSRFWIYTIIGGSLLFAMYLFVIWVITGNFLQRFEAISKNSYLNLCSYDKQSIIILIERVAYGFFELIIYQGMATGYIFVIAALIGRNVFQLFKMQDSFSFWVTSSFILLLSSNFMSISLTSYSPMCLDPRHYLFLIPVVAIPASIIIREYIESKAFNVPILTLAGLTAIISFFLSGNTFIQLYFPLFLLLFIYQFFKVRRLYQYMFIVILIGILLIKLFSMINYAKKIKYRKQKEIFKEEVFKTNDSIIVITNEVQRRLGNYYNDFSNKQPYSILNYKDFSYDSTDTRKKILFLNWYTRYLSNMDYHDLPYYAKNISTKNKLLYQNKKLNIAVYEMTDFSIPEQTGKLLLQSFNDFENNIDYWSLNTENISQEIKHEGNFSYQFIEYSSTFEYHADSLDLDRINQIIIRCSAYCNFESPTNSKLIISVENDDGAYIWNGIEINKYLKAFSNWWQISHEISINKSELRENSKIKVYLWNPDKQPAYIDDFKVEIYGNRN